MQDDVTENSLPQFRIDDVIRVPYFPGELLVSRSSPEFLIAGTKRTVISITDFNEISLVRHKGRLNRLIKDPILQLIPEDTPHESQTSTGDTSLQKLPGPCTLSDFGVGIS